MIVSVEFLTFTKTTVSLERVLIKQPCFPSTRRARKNQRKKKVSVTI